MYRSCLFFTLFFTGQVRVRGRESSFVLVELARFSSLPGGGIRVFGTVLVQSVFMTSTPAGEFTEEVKTGDSVQRSPLA